MSEHTDKATVRPGEGNPGNASPEDTSQREERPEDRVARQAEERAREGASGAGQLPPTQPAETEYGEDDSA